MAEPEVEEKPETSSSSLPARMKMLAASILSLMGLTHVVNDVHEGLVVWHSFMLQVDQVYVYTREAISTLLFRWWLPAWPAWLTDIVIVMFSLNGIRVVEDASVNGSILYKLPKKFLKGLGELGDGVVLRTTMFFLFFCIMIIPVVLVLVFFYLYAFSLNMRYIPACVLAQSWIRLGIPQPKWVSVHKNDPSSAMTFKRFYFLVAFAAIVLLVNYQILKRYAPGSLV